jgi:hypothetical protein
MQRIEGMNLDKKQKHNSSEPLFYVALVLRSTEDQYLDLIRYIDRDNGAKLIYQCKSIAYLRVVRDDGVKCQITAPELMAEATGF